MLTGHRQHPRFRLLNTTARSAGFEAPVLDLSRAGMGIQPPQRLTIGDDLHFRVGDHNHAFRVVGRVCWSGDADEPAAGGAHRSGIRFTGLLSPEANGVWARLVAENGETGLAVGHRLPAGDPSPRVPLLIILSPEDGEVTHQGTVTVIGQVRDPGLGAMIEVNGVPALVYGRRFEARVPLNQGANLVSAAVSTSMALVCRSSPVRVIRSASSC